MKRLSLFYLASYLLGGGLALVAAPAFALRLLQSSGSYGDVMPRMVGLLMIALGGLVAMIIRHRLDVFYRFMVELRVALIAGLAWLLVRSGDPLFGVLIAVVGVGVVLTLIGFVVDGRGRAAAGAQVAR